MFLRSVILLGFLAAGVVPTLAQSAANDDFKPGEFYVGYSATLASRGIDPIENGSSDGEFFRNRKSFNGINFSAAYNLSRNFGIKGDFSASFSNVQSSQSITGPLGSYTISAREKNSLYNFLGGIQVKNNSSSGRLKPFAHALVGIGSLRSKVEDFSCNGAQCISVIVPGSETRTSTGFAAAFGGGVDIRLNKRVQLRLIQIDYNPIWVFEGARNNFRLGAGVVF